MEFPYEKQFRHYLTNKRVLADSTQQDICSDVERLFTHLRQFNLVYRLNPSLSNIEESDVRDYLNMLQVKREIKIRPTTRPDASERLFHFPFHS